MNWYHQVKVAIEELTSIEECGESPEAIPLTPQDAVEVRNKIETIRRVRGQLDSLLQESRERYERLAEAAECTGGEGESLPQEREASDVERDRPVEAVDSGE